MLTRNLSASKFTVKIIFFYKPQEFTVNSEDLEKGSKLLQAIYLTLDLQFRVIVDIPGVYKAMVRYEKKLQEEYEKNKLISNYIQGTRWRNYFKQIFKDKTVHPICGFFDDLETGNNQGSHAGKQKFGAVYVFFVTFPPYLRLKLKNIVLSTLFHSDDRKSYGNNKVFEKFIRDVNNLSEKGLEINFDGKPIQIFFQLVAFLGDNLGLNRVRI